MLLKPFLAYLKRHDLCRKDDRILVTVSAGADSMVLAELFLAAGYDIAVATCNHGFRGEESIADKDFVVDYFQQKGVAVFATDLDVMALVTEGKRNKQDAGRELRYAFFNKIAQKNGFSHIATAHHKNDNVETMLFNLSNKTGVRGLSGIQNCQQTTEGVTLIRPLLFAEKTAIYAFAKIKNIPFREDPSNEKDSYKRNFIRNRVVPELEKVNNRFVQNAAETISYMADYEVIVDFFIKKIKEEIVFFDEKIIEIDFLALKKYPSPTTILFELIRDFGFNGAQCSEVFQALESCHNGAQWLSESHRMISDRDFILIKNIKNNIVQNFDNEIFINKENSEIVFSNGKLLLEFVTEIPVTFPKSDDIIYIDVTKTVFPLRLRSWQAGDFFLPLGLSGKRKKVQDFFTDLKFNLFQKEETILLESDGNIVWVIGYRADERFRITPTSASVLKITYLPK
jgi:tRNA(Ile)-lysidine synthase